MLLKNTTWPDISVPTAVKAWLESLLEQLDSKEPSAPEKAAALFTEDAEVWGMAGKALGTEEIIKARTNSWSLMESRNHEILSVYSVKTDFSDILLLCRLTAKFKNGKEASDDFVVRVVFIGDTSLEPKGSLYKIYADSLPWLRAIHDKEPFASAH